MVKDSVNKRVEWVIGQLILRRKELGLSHEKLAQQTKLTRAGISYIESRKRMPTIATLFKICDALEVSLADIIRHYEEDHRSD